MEMHAIVQNERFNVEFCAATWHERLAHRCIHVSPLPRLFCCPRMLVKGASLSWLTPMFELIRSRPRDGDRRWMIAVVYGRRADAWAAPRRTTSTAPEI
jgi:hypothetical protein